MNAGIDRYYQSMGPAMIRMLKMIADGFIKAGKPLSVCGELGGDPRMAVVFVGLGIRKLSMSHSCFAGVKEALSGITLKEAEEITESLLSMRTQAEIEKYLKEKISCISRQSAPSRRTVKKIIVGLVALAHCYRFPDFLVDEGLAGSRPRPVTHP
nr:putative PEP-binding protein [uncultured Clostridium sp.]